MPIDLERYLERVAAGSGGRPIPLIGTDIRLRIAGGRAVVETTRSFRNDGARSVEATLTFPIPIHATLFDLTAEIDGRLLRASAQRRNAARARYEDAIDRGKTGVLHEEVLRGIHMLSVGHVAPGKLVVVTSAWAMPLAASAAALTLRIPTTCGDVYGRSPLPASDDLLRDPSALLEATLEIASDSGTVVVAGAEFRDGRTRVRLDRPIDTEIHDATLRPMRGLAADGRSVLLAVTPVAAGQHDLDTAILIDRSGSMASPAVVTEGNPRPASKHAVVTEALNALSQGLTGADRLRLWQFNDRPEHIADCSGDHFSAALGGIEAPSGGTATGSAINAVLCSGVTRDVLLVTDGLSHALDVQAAARSGRRFTVVLIGEDALEAHVGHLAALTGGDIFLAAGDAASAVQMAFAALRRPHDVLAPIADVPTDAEACRGGMRIRAEWTRSPAVDPAQDDGFARAVAAVAASLAIPRMNEADATALAEEECIVCHLTSLILVDDAGDIHQGIPAQRKIPLMTPSGRRQEPELSMASMSLSEGRAMFSIQPFAYSFGSLASDPTRLLREVAQHIDWSADPDRLRRGDFTELPELVVEALEWIASNCHEVIDLATKLGQSPLLTVLALLALDVDGDRNAARLARSILAPADAASLGAAVRALALSKNGD